MTIFVNDKVLDAPLDLIIADADFTHLLTAYPANYAAVGADTVGSYAPVIGKVDNGGAGGGRSGQMSAQADVTIDTATNHASGNVTVTHFAIVDDATGTVLYVGEVNPNKSFDNGDKANAPAQKLNILDGVVAP